MYDRPETAAANDRLWAFTREHLGFGPAALSREVEGLDHWLSPNLILSQTCGMPYREHLHGRIKLVGTPVWDLEDVPRGYYRSVIITRREAELSTFIDCTGHRFACNMALSQSGWAAAENEAMAHGFSFTDVILTGSHIASAKAVADGGADVAAIDVVTWELIQRYSAALAEGLHVIHNTPSTPALPYITAWDQDPDKVYDAIEAAIHKLAASDRNVLCLKGVTKIDPQDYLAVPSPAFPKVSRR